MENPKLVQPSCGKGHDRLKKAFAVSCHGLVASSNSAQKAVIEAWIPVRIGLRLFKPVVRRDFHEAPHLHGNVAGTPHIPPQFAMLILFKMMARPACKPCSSMSWVLYLRTPGAAQSKSNQRSMAGLRCRPPPGHRANHTQAGNHLRPRWI